jgi:hypothetical protein
MTRHSRPLAGILTLAVLSSSLLFVPACKTITDEELKAAIQIEILDTKWVEKEYKTWPKPKLVVVPSVILRFKNLSDKPMRYVKFNGVFKQKTAVQNIGEDYQSSGKERVAPGAWSAPITLKSDHGYEGTNLANIKDNPEFKPHWVRIVAEWKAARKIVLGEWPVSMKIDFKEPGIPVIQGGKPVEPVKKDTAPPATKK